MVDSLDAVDVVILAGGQGTRLRSVLPDGLPKALAPINNRPFIEYLLEKLNSEGARRVILSLGYGADAIRRAIGRRVGSIDIEYVTETTPLGTGGAIKLALKKAQSTVAIVMNGDTVVFSPIQPALSFHIRESSSLTIGCVAVPEVARYGAVELRGDRIVTFGEKSKKGAGIINAGVYFLASNYLNSVADEAFSFEKDILGSESTRAAAKGFLLDGDFIDIGVPADLVRAADVFRRL